jgi:hypothetical protein
MANEDLKSELKLLKLDNERRKAQHARGLCLKVERGQISVYGLDRYPVTLYKEQWRNLLAIADDIQTFAKEHEAELMTGPG